MKRWIASLLTACVLLPGAALADNVLVDNWKDATLDELLEAKAAMNQQIASLVVHQEVPAEGFTISGTGLSVTDGYTLPAGLWQRIIKIPNAKTYEDKLTFTVGGENRKIEINNQTIATPCYSTSDKNVDYVVVETEGTWSITYEPIGTDGTISIGGNGGVVSDFFVCERPTVVTIKAQYNGTAYWKNFSVRLYSLSQSGSLSSEYSSELMANELISAGEGATVQAIIKPENSKVAYLWVVETDDDMTWSITAK